MMNTELIEIAGLSVELVRKSIKNLHIGVYPPAGRVRVAAPAAISEDAVRVAVVTRLGWIKNKQREFRNQAREAERQYVSGETHHVFGKPKRLMVEHVQSSRSGVRLFGPNWLIMEVSGTATSDQKSGLLAAWYRQQLRERATPLVTKWADRLEVPKPRWGIRIMRTKWGSCNPNKALIWINLDLAKKPLLALDYVILHEMAHFISPRHNKVFLDVLDRNMPSWRQVRADLNSSPISEWGGSPTTQVSL